MLYYLRELFHFAKELYCFYIVSPEEHFVLPFEFVQELKLHFIISIVKVEKKGDFAPHFLQVFN